MSPEKKSSKPLMINSFKTYLKLLLPKYQKLILDYKIDMKPRYGYGLPAHKLLYDIINKNKKQYEHFFRGDITSQRSFSIY